MRRVVVHTADHIFTYKNVQSVSIDKHGILHVVYTQNNAVQLDVYNVHEWKRYSDEVVGTV